MVDNVREGSVKMLIHDISMTIKNDMKVYKNKDEKRPLIRKIANHESNGMSESEILMNLHTGTHMDAQLHMIKGGKTIEDIPLADLVTKCRVIDFTEITSSINAEHLKDLNIKEGEFILFKTRNSLNKEFNPEFIYLSSSGAEILLDLKIKGVGIDALGIERSQSDHLTHKILFQGNIHIIEGLDLSLIKEGYYTLIALPLKIKDADGSPIRAILIEDFNME